MYNLQFVIFTIYVNILKKIELNQSAEIAVN